MLIIRNKFCSTTVHLLPHFCIILLLIIGISCQTERRTKDYPAGSTFDFKNSSPKAIEIANKVMEAMGGYEKYNKIRYYVIYGRTSILYWDKHKNMLRLTNYPNSKFKDQYIYDVRKNNATILYKDHLITHGDSLILFRNSVRNIFEIETFHLLLPFKMKDSGVTLKYLGEVRKLRNGNPGEKIQLTFTNVGRVPTAKFHVYIDKTDYRINRYEFFRNVKDAEPSSTFRADQYKRLRGVLFSFNRTDGKGVKKVYLPDSIPKNVFESFEVKPAVVVKLKDLD